MAPRLIHRRDGGLAIEIGRDNDTYWLAVPRWHPQTNRATRVKILEHVLRGQIGLAMVIAEIERDSIESRDRLDRKAAEATVALMSAHWQTAA